MGLVKDGVASKCRACVKSVKQIVFTISLHHKIEQSSHEEVDAGALLSFGHNLCSFLKVFQLELIMKFFSDNVGYIFEVRYLLKNPDLK